jgi:uncharacterized protein YrrD
VAEAGARYNTRMATLHLAGKIRGAPVMATDGEIGSVDDFYFDEKVSPREGGSHGLTDGGSRNDETPSWTVRYVLVDTGRWFSAKRVLLSPMSVAGPWSRAGVNVTLTRDQVWHSPQIDSSTLSPEQVEDIRRHYGYPIYWGAAGIWGSFENPGALIAAPTLPPRPPGGPVVRVEAEHLRSVNASTGYHLHASDGAIGHVDDFLIGETTWRIRYLLVDTSNWIGGKWVVVRTDEIRSIDRDRGVLHVAASRDDIRNSPSFESIEAAVGAGEAGPPFVLL